MPPRIIFVAPQYISPANRRLAVLRGVKEVMATRIRAFGINTPAELERDLLSYPTPAQRRDRLAALLCGPRKDAVVDQNFYNVRQWFNQRNPMAPIALLTRTTQRRHCVLPKRGPKRGPKAAPKRGPKRIQPKRRVKR